MKNLSNVERVILIITYYGYQDGSGEYYIVIDGEKCNSCSKCIEICPQDAIMMDSIFIDLEDKMVATITEEQRKKIRYTCSPCKPEKGNTPCVESCAQNAIKCIWKPK